MPTYSFVCLECDTEFDKNVSYDNINSVMCEKCGYRTRRVYSFKGLVWSPTRNSGYS
jgi:putative FmdB family regulatory protein